MCCHRYPTSACVTRNGRYRLLFRKGILVSSGDAIGGLILFYTFPVYACLWVVDYFRVRRLSALVLAAALFVFLVEGVLTPAIYEAGLFDPVIPALTIGWHGLLSVIFGWYCLRKWLISGQWGRLIRQDKLNFCAPIPALNGHTAAMPSHNLFHNSQP